MRLRQFARHEAQIAWIAPPSLGGTACRVRYPRAESAFGPRDGLLAPREAKLTESRAFRGAFVVGARAARATGRRGHDARRVALRWAWAVCA
jgi:hypothetical protein